MDDTTISPEDPSGNPLVDRLDHRVAIGSVFGIVLAAVIALNVGGNALIVLIGALLLGMVGVAAAAL